MQASKITQRRSQISATAGLLAMCSLALVSAPRTAAAQQVESAPKKAPTTRTTSTGNAYQQALDTAYSRFKTLQEGKNADYIPVLAQVDPRLYGIAIVTVKGEVYEAGDARHAFSIQSAAKPFVLARTMSELGPKTVREQIGVNQTGQPFNSVNAIEQLEDAKRPPAGNPLVNAGAITTVDLLPERDSAAKWRAIMDTLNGFAGRLLTVNEDVFRSESETNTHNRAIAGLLVDYKVIKGDPSEALDLYTKECSVSVTARDLATMGATLANAGVNPLTKQQVVSPDVARHVLAVMATSGLYENSGDWLYQVGVPAKSGVGGGIVAVVPGRFAVGTFAPPLDEAGNSVRGQYAIAQIVNQLGGNMFSSAATQTGAQAGAQPRAAASPSTTKPREPQGAAKTNASKGQGQAQ
jgi:glutaminase